MSSREYVTVSEGPNEFHEGAFFRVIQETATGRFYRVSSIPYAFDTGKPETLVFECDSEGDITNWTDIAGGMYKSMDEAIDDLSTVLDGRERGMEESPMFAEHGLIGGALNTLQAMFNSLEDEDA